MNVTLSGSTGFIGQALTNKMSASGLTVRVIKRSSFGLSVEEFSRQFIEGADVVVNLAGAPVAKRWSTAWKQEIMDSRIQTTRKIADAILVATQKPKVFISGSAIGIYNNSMTHDESSSGFSDSFLARVCLDWEAEAMKAATATRVVIFRLGVVLGENGGALQKMHLPFSIGLGGKLGTGKQAVSFIHLYDLIEAIMFAISNSGIDGVVNAVSPVPSTNAELTDKLAKVLHQPAWLTVPAFALKIAFGEGAQVLLEGQTVVPDKLVQAGFRFKYPTIQNALVAIYG